MDMDMQCGLGHVLYSSMETDIQHGHGHAAWTWTLGSLIFNFFLEILKAVPCDW